jgi:hypothetical protein
MALFLLFPLAASQTDWMLRSAFAPVTVEQSASGISLSNGIVERRFFVSHLFPWRHVSGWRTLHADATPPCIDLLAFFWCLRFQISGGAFCTIEYQLLLKSTTFFRGLSPESNLTLDGRPYNVGGCQGVGQDHFEFWNPDVYLKNLSSDASAFQYISHTLAPPDEPFKWRPGTRHSPPTVAWPPAGTPCCSTLQRSNAALHGAAHPVPDRQACGFRSPLGRRRPPLPSTST